MTFYLSNKQIPTNFGLPVAKSITFEGNIEEWLSNEKNVNALNQVITGKGCIICLPTFELTGVVKRLDR